MEQANNYKYRVASRIVAICDLIVTAMSLWVPIVLFTTASVLSFQLKDTKESAKYNGNKSQGDSSSKHRMFLFWIGGIFSLAVVTTQLFAGLKLLSATQLGRQPQEAIKMAKLWRNFTIIFTIILLFGILGEVGQSIVYFTSVITHCIGLHIVQKFISEVENAAEMVLFPRLGIFPIPAATLEAGRFHDAPPTNAAPPNDSKTLNGRDNDNDSSSDNNELPTYEDAIKVEAQARKEQEQGEMCGSDKPDA